MPALPALPALPRWCDASTDIYALGVSTHNLISAIGRVHTPTAEHPALCLLVDLQQLAEQCTSRLGANRPTARQVHGILSTLLA